MHSLTLIANNSQSIAFQVISSLSDDWVFSCSGDAGSGLRACAEDEPGMEWASKVESAVVWERRFPAAPWAEYAKLQRFLDARHSVPGLSRLINGWDVHCAFSGDLDLKAVNEMADQVALNSPDGYVTWGVMCEMLGNRVGEHARISLWTPAPDWDFDNNTLLLFRDRDTLEKAEARLRQRNVGLCRNEGEAAAAWKQSGRQFYCHGGEFLDFVRPHRPQPPRATPPIVILHREATVDGAALFIADLACELGEKLWTVVDLHQEQFAVNEELESRKVVMEGGVIGYRLLGNELATLVRSRRIEPARASFRVVGGDSRESPTLLIQSVGELSWLGMSDDLAIVERLKRYGFERINDK